MVGGGGGAVAAVIVVVVKVVVEDNEKLLGSCSVLKLFEAGSEYEQKNVFAFWLSQLSNSEPTGRPPSVGVHFVVIGNLDQLFA